MQLRIKLLLVSQNLVDLLLKIVVSSFQIDWVKSYGYSSSFGLDILNISSVDESGLTQATWEVGRGNTL